MRQACGARSASWRWDGWTWRSVRTVIRSGTLRVAPICRVREAPMNERRGGSMLENSPALVCCGTTPPLPIAVTGAAAGGAV